MEIYDVSKHSYLKNGILLYFIPGAIFILLFFLSDAEFCGCRVYQSLKLNTLLQECNSITVTSAITGFIILFSIPYVLGHIFALLSGCLLCCFNYKKSLAKYLYDHEIDFQALFEENNIKISDEKKMNIFGKHDFGKFNYCYHYLIAKQSKHLYTLAQYNLMLNFFKNLSLVFMFMIIIIFIMSFVQLSNPTNKCKPTCNSTCTDGTCNKPQDTTSNLQVTLSNIHQETITQSPASLADTTSAQSSIEIKKEIKKPNINSLETTIPTLLWIIILVYLSISAILLCGIKKYSEKRISEILYAISTINVEPIDANLKICNTQQKHST